MSKEIKLVNTENYTPTYSGNLIPSLVGEVKNTSIVSKEQGEFLLANTENFNSIMKNTYVWRTKNQKLSIVSDDYHPTLHSKFHQVILESKVFFENMIQLWAESERSKIDLQRKELDLQESEEKLSSLDHNSLAYKREILNQEEIKIDLKIKVFNFEQNKNAMNYRIKELQQWKEIQDALYTEMKKEGLSDEEIWDKETNEIEGHFFLFLNNLKGIGNSTDGGEINNLIALARHGVKTAKQAGIYDRLIKKCTPAQLNALKLLETQIGL